MKVLTANRLTDGEAVWLGADGSWIPTIAGSDLVSDKAGEARLEALGQVGLDSNLVVDVNLIDVDVVDGAIRPARLRERIRASGPTTHPELGKQAQQNAGN